MDTAAEVWIRRRVEAVGDLERRERPWATVVRVPVADGAVWFKASGAVQAFEPRLSVELFNRWPDRVAQVLGHGEGRGWLLLADAGAPIGASRDSLETWLAVLPLYAELQRGEAAHADAHLAHGVPDLRLAALPGRYEKLVRLDLPLDRDEIGLLAAFAPRFAELCAELAEHGIPETVQHDDLHMANVFVCDGQIRVLDWGDASISHPFASLVVTFRFLEERAGLSPADPWFGRLRDAYLEPWGGDLAGVFALARRVGMFAHSIAWARQRDFLRPEDRPDFDKVYAVVLRRALVQVESRGSNPT